MGEDQGGPAATTDVTEVTTTVHLWASVEGVARVDRRTKDLAKRIDIGEIAVIDHEDLDTVATDSLIAAGISAVINAADCISGRYPNDDARSCFRSRASSCSMAWGPRS